MLRAVAMFSAVDLFLLLFGLWLDKSPLTHRKGYLSVTGSVAAFAFAALVFACTAGLTYQLVHPLVALSISILFGIPVAVHYAHKITHAISNATAESFNGLTTVAPPSSDFSKARTLEMRQDIDGAVTQYWNYFWEDRERDAAPLFAAEALLEKHRRYADAAGILREVMRLFAADDVVWTRAAYKLATLFTNHLEEPETGRFLYREIVRRSPDSELGHLAHGHLTGVWQEASE